MTSLGSNGACGKGEGDGAAAVGGGGPRRSRAARREVEGRSLRGGARRDPATREDLHPFLAAVVAGAFRLPAAILSAPTRRADVALARQVAIYVAHVGLAETLTAAGRRFGRDRSTAAHACRRVEDRRDDPRFDGLVAGIEAAVVAARGPDGAEAGR